MFTIVEVIALLKTYGYLLIFPIAFLEGPIIAVICGWFSAVGILNFFIAYFLLILANLLGDVIYYLIGYWGGPPLIRRWGHWIGLDLEQTIKLKNHFDNHGGKILLTAKITPHIAVAAVLAGAGLAKYSFSRFLRYGLTIEIFKTAILMLIGYFIGDAYQKVFVYLDYFAAITSVAIAVIIGVSFYYWRQSRKNNIQK